MFLDPTGAQIGEQIQGEEGIAYADLDLNDCVAPKQFHDGKSLKGRRHTEPSEILGYYSRPRSHPRWSET